MKPASPMSGASRAEATPAASATKAAWLIAFVCFCVMTVDGFDTASIAFVAPSLAIAWHLPHAALTPAFVMTSVGAVIGYLASDLLVSRLGRRRVIALAMVAFGVLSVATAFVDGIGAMSVMRLLTAICLGCVVPATISCAADHASAARRAATTIAVTTGLSVGGALGGLLASQLLTCFGWTSVFIAGGVLPLVLLPFVLGVLPGDAADRPINAAANDTGAKRVSMAALWQAPFTLTTLLIWAIAFFVFLVTYQFIFWIPTLLVSYGFPPASAALGSAASATGSVLGCLALIPFIGRFGVHRVLMVTACLAIACIAVLSTGVVDKALVLWLIAGIGAGTASGCVGQATLAVLAYPERLRTAGVGCAAAAGRVGAIIGPGAGGALLSIGLNAQQIVTLCCVPIILVVGLLVVSRRLSMR